MQTPHDLRHFDSAAYDGATLLLRPETAFHWLIAVIVIGAILEPVLR